MDLLECSAIITKLRDILFRILEARASFIWVSFSVNPLQMLSSVLTQWQTHTLPTLKKRNQWKLFKVSKIVRKLVNLHSTSESLFPPMLLCLMAGRPPGPMPGKPGPPPEAMETLSEAPEFRFWRRIERRLKDPPPPLRLGFLPNLPWVIRTPLQPSSLAWV